MNFQLQNTPLQIYPSYEGITETCHSYMVRAAPRASRFEITHLRELKKKNRKETQEIERKGDFSILKLPPDFIFSCSLEKAQWSKAHHEIMLPGLKCL